MVLSIFFDAASGTAAGDTSADTVDILAGWGIPVTSGAAAGYVPDDTCATCHSDKAESFSDVGMARSFSRPSPGNVIEDFDNNAYYHAPSDRHYEMEMRSTDYWFRRYTLAADGTRINLFEQKIDWIVGSGYHSRVYLYRTPDGAMFQLPLAWYTQDRKWAMAPGFEFETHLGVGRLVRRRCMACHNAFPDVPAGSDRAEMPEVFPETLPEGIGCQRCHGPGARHAALAHDGEQPLDDVRAAIVDPGKLPRERLYDICYGCHMQPTVAVPAELRLGRGAYSFRPGQALADYVAEIEITDADRAKGDRFEINHHPYRLEQSTCFVESGGELGCLTCHDPHVKIAPGDRAAHYRQACLSCHETDDSGLPEMAADRAHPAIAEDDDCTMCHMPARRTQDVTDVWMTDHRIVRDPGPGDLLAPLEKQRVEVAEIRLMHEDHGLQDDEALIYRTMALLHYTSGQADYAADALDRVLGSGAAEAYEPWLALAKSRVATRRYGDALDAAERAHVLAPDVPETVEALALAKYGSGDRQGGIAMLSKLVADNPALTDQRYNLAVFYRGTGDLDAALGEMREVLKWRPNRWQAWRTIGDIELQRGNAGEAANAYRDALATEPADERSRKGLISALETLGKSAEADLYR